MSKNKRLLICSFLCMAFAIVFYLNSSGLPDVARRLPLLLCILIVFLSLIIACQALYKMKKEYKDPVPQKNESVINYIRVSIFAAAIGVYIALIKPAGYFTVTPIFMLLAFSYLNIGSWFKRIAITAVFTVFVYVLFVAFLKLPIPLGPIS